MKVTEAKYACSAVGPGQYPADNLPELAFAGRSNVGKSSLLNALLNRRSLARISSRPGKTQTINFYLVNQAFYLVDFPGYGFARVSKEIKSTWGRMIEGYLKGRTQLKGVVQLIDIRHEPTADDIQMYQWLQFFGFPTIVVATKADKLSRSKALQQLKMIRSKLKIPADGVLLPFSAISKEGVDHLWELLAAWMD